MAKVIVGMSMSVDGFVSDDQGSVALLYPDFEAFQKSDLLKETIEQTGAVVMGRKAFAMADDPDWYAGNYEFQVPIFVLTHEIPARHPKETDKLSFTFVTDGIERAIEQAKAAAGDKDVTVIGGASTIRQCLEARVADELHIDLMPVLLGGGLRLFEDLGIAPIQLERLKVVSLPGGRTHFRFRVEK